MFLLKKRTNKIPLRSNDNKTDGSIKTYTYATSKDLAREKETIKCNNIIKQYEIN